MKNSRNILLMLIFTAMAAVVCSCNDTKAVDKKEDKPAVTKEAETETTEPEASENTMTLVVEGEPLDVYTVDLDKVEGEEEEGLIPVLDYLKENEGLEYEANDSTYGKFLTKVNAAEQNEAENQYVYIYTSVEKDYDVSDYATTKDYEGLTLNSSGVGASDLTLTDDCVIYISTIKY